MPAGHISRTFRQHSLILLCVAAVAVCAGSSLAGEPVTFLRRPVPEQFNVRGVLTVPVGAGVDWSARILFEEGEGQPHHELRLSPGKAWLLTVSGGKEAALGAPAACGVTPGQHEVLLKRRLESVAVFVDDRLVLGQAVSGARRGRVGYAAVGEGAALSGVRAQPVGPIRFTDDFTRTAEEPGAWESITGTWAVAAVSQAGFSSNAFCFRGVGERAMALAGHWFWEDYRYSCAIRRRESTSVVGLVFNARDKDNHLCFRWRSGVFELVRVVSGHEEVVAKQECGLRAEQWYEMSVCAVQGTVGCYLDRQQVFEARVPSPQHGKIGLVVSGRDGVYVDDVRVESVDRVAPQPIVPRIAEVGEVYQHDKYMKEWATLVAADTANVLDYTFHTAPTDWLVQSGTWGLQTRWSCQPRWTWFGGGSKRSAVIWHKHELEGDLTVDVFAAFRMDSPFDPIYRRTADINVTFCGDGENLDSGYSFIFAGWGNRWTRLMRGSDVAAETQKVLLPDNRDRFQYKGIHISWQHVRITKKSGHVECSVNGKPALAFDDPTPLTGRRLGIWTWDNQLMVARVRIQAERVTPGALPPGGGTGGTGGLKASGGDGVAFLDVRGVDVRRKPRLRFRYRGPEGMRSNLYFLTRGQLHCIVFSAPGIAADGIPVVGRFDSPVLDGQWHTADVDVLGGISGVYSDGRPLVIDSAYMGLESDEPYRLCGFNGNRAEMTCEFADVAMVSGPSKTVSRPAVRPVEPAVPAALCVDTFEDDVGQWHGLDGAEGATVVRDPWHAASGRFALKLVNTRLGGTFAAGIRRDPYNPRRYPIIRFDYRADDDLRVDLLVGLDDGKRVAVRFTDRDATWPVIGRIPKVRQDRTWHRAEFNLLEMLRKAQLGDRYVTSLVLASTGFPGNGENLTYWLDNLAILPDPGASALPADKTAPVLGARSPAPDSRAGNGRIELTLSDKESGVDAASIRLTVDDETYHIGARSLAYDCQAGRLTWSATETPGGGTVFTEKAPVRCTLRASDEAGNAMAPVTWAWTYAFAEDKAPPPAPFVSYVPSNRLCRHTFEAPVPNPRGGGPPLLHTDTACSPPPVLRSSSPPVPQFCSPAVPQSRCPAVQPLDSSLWGDWGACRVTATSDMAATGRSCLALTNSRPGGSSTRALGNITHIPLDKYPYVRVDFNLAGIPPDQPVSFGILKLFFDGEKDKYAFVANRKFEKPVPGWQSLDADLRKHMKPGAGDPYGILLGDTTGKVIRPGGTIYADNVTIYSRRDPTPGFEWNPPADPSGIAGYSWVLDQNSETLPPADVKTSDTHAQLKGVKAGRWWFHVRAVDKAGNWGSSGHCWIVVEE